MTLSVAFLCGRGQSWRIVSASCDAPGCREVCHYATAAEYAALGAAGWRKAKGDPGWVACPRHSGAQLPL